jgi:tetratricopeptide (TPR) repeat protein
MTPRSVALGTPDGSGLPSHADSVAILINQGLLLAQQQNYDEAVRSLSAAVVANPASSIALRLLGLIFHLMGKGADALAEFDRALSTDPSDATAYYYRCLSTAPTDAVSAVRDCQAALGLQPNFPEVHLGLANAFYVLGETHKAYEEANTAIRQLPDSPLGYSMRGKIAATMGQYTSAQRDYDTAVRLTPTSSSEQP